jgi:hypothetical protein
MSKGLKTSQNNFSVNSIPNIREKMYTFVIILN